MTSGTRAFYDYTRWAEGYAGRADYVPAVITAVLRTAVVATGDRVCDVGAGTGNLTLPLLDHGLTVDAVEPTPAMRERGVHRTADRPGVTWHDGTGEATGRPDGAYALVTFGSSFDVLDRAAALTETARLLRPGGHVVCLWNHRVLTDPLQAAIEELIRDHVPGYDYGVRRSDQSPVITASGLFDELVEISGEASFEFGADAWCTGWESHATLARQAGDALPRILDGIRELVARRSGETVAVPYRTRAWVARLAGPAGSAAGARTA